MRDDASTSAITLPKGGGAMHGIGEKFAPDLHTGTGNFTVPIVVPPGRNGVAPTLNLVYSSGHGNGVFGLGWSLTHPCITRRTAKGVPLYDDERDVFILAGSEDLVRVGGSYPGRARYRPRTEGLFARIEHVRDAQNDYWEIRTQDGSIAVYGTARPAGAPPAWSDPAVVPGPAGRHRPPFTWNVTETRDPFGNAIRYRYGLRDSGADGPHTWDQPLLTEITYVDYSDQENPQFLVRITFIYTARTDSSSSYRAGFEQRTTRLCQTIRVETLAGVVRRARDYDFTYVPEPANGVALLNTIQIRGYDDDGHAVDELPPLEFSYTQFSPTTRRRFRPLTGHELPARALGREMNLIDVFGQGLPAIVETAGAIRYWRNLGDGSFDWPRPMRDAPSVMAVAGLGSQLVDANGDGRADLLVTTPTGAGYFPLQHGGTWDRRSFQPYAAAPTFSLTDAEVALVDLDGDGVTDAIRSGARLECYFNDPHTGWGNTRWVERKHALTDFPDVSFSDPRVRWSDMTGDGLQDIVLLFDGNVEYWPSIGRGEWGPRVHMRNSPVFPYGYDVRRILLGDVDGDGLADLVYIDDDRVLLWLNQSGNAWSADPIVIEGTPRVGPLDDVRLADMFGTGIVGVLWSTDAGSARDHLWFLDFTGGEKPYLLDRMDNHLGAVTTVEYAPSTAFYTEDRRERRIEWRTPLPFPVHVVKRVEVLDDVSRGRLVSEYRYRHGYWDGAEREFRGFGMVEQLDTSSVGAAGTHVSPPMLTRTWFHQGAVGDEHGAWAELDYGDEFWSGDPQRLGHAEYVNEFLASFPDVPSARRAKRDALRALRGRVLRTEVYARDATAREPRPYTVSEYAYGVFVVREDGLQAELVDRPAPTDLPADLQGPPRLVFFPHARTSRVTEWERGDDPSTQFAFTSDYDPFGHAQRETRVACPRGWRQLSDVTTGYLATRARTLYARPTDPAATTIFDRVARVTTYELEASTPRTVEEIAALADADPAATLIGQSLHFYDGAAFTGLPNGTVGTYGALTRSERLVLTDDILAAAYGAERPPHLAPTAPVWPAEYPAAFASALPPRAGYIWRSGDGVVARGYFVADERRRYDFHEPGRPARGLIIARRPPLGQADERDTRTTYDDYDLLPIRVTDALGLSTAAEHNYRVLRPRSVEDVNGNRTWCAFTGLGLLAETRVTGKAGEGDQLFPSVVATFDFRAFHDRREPIFVHTIRRLHHDADADIAASERDETIETREYYDGFGRTVQKRTHAEDVLFGTLSLGNDLVPADQAIAPGAIAGSQRAAASPVNVVVSGWQTYDNKGRVVEKWEPFYDQGWTYKPPEDEPAGAKTTLFYDPRGKVIRTVNPDGSEQRVVMGVPADLDVPEIYDPTPWERYTYDANDNAGRTHAATTGGYASHRNTPSSAVVDALGRQVEAVVRNRAAAGGPLEVGRTRMTYDIRGNLVTVTDALGRSALQTVYDLANRKLTVDSIDAGGRRSVLDAAGNVVEQRDGRGALSLRAHDVANRPTRIWARDATPAAVALRERIEYGDGSDPGQAAAERHANRSVNRLGRPLRHYDEAGVTTFESYDFKGNVLLKTRRVFDGSVLAPGWHADWEAAGAAAALATGNYQTTASFDALGRVRAIVYPTDVSGERKQLSLAYNRAGALQSVTLAGQLYVRHIAYNARGQRTLVVYGNDVFAALTYDALTFRLRRLWSGRCSTPPGTSFTYLPLNSGQPLQDLGYEYDLAGNLLKLSDRTPASGVPPSANLLDRLFEYDALYRLLSATGRECDTPSPPAPWDDTFRCHDPAATRAYTETYWYDEAGNMTRLQHSASGASVMRTLDLSAGTNRLTRMTVGATPYDYAYDANGNLTAETTSRHFEWDHADRLKRYHTQAGAGPASVDAYYLYDASGRRVLKVCRRGPVTESTISIDGIFEHQIRGAVENNTLHVMDDRRRIATLRVGPAFADDGAADKPVQYHLEDHLGNSHVVVGGTAATHNAFVNREEYTPYGDTSFGSYGRKRYRFSGKERDEESGLSYHGARYYAPWLARWVSCDPAGFIEGANLYRFARTNPMRFADATGLSGDDKNDPLAQGKGPIDTTKTDVDPKVDPKVVEEVERRGKQADSLVHEFKVWEKKVARAAGAHASHVRKYNDALATLGNNPQGDVAANANEALHDAADAIARDEKAIERLAARGRELYRQAFTLRQEAQQIAETVERAGGAAYRTLAGPAQNTAAKLGAVETDLITATSSVATVRASAGEAAAAAVARQPIRRGLTGQVAEAGTAGTEAEAAAARGGRFTKLLKVGGVVLFFGDLITSGANEAGVWDCTVGGVLNLGYNGAVSTYEAGKAGVKAWLSTGWSLSSGVDKYTRP